MPHFLEPRFRSAMRDWQWKGLLSPGMAAGWPGPCWLRHVLERQNRELCIGLFAHSTGTSPFKMRLDPGATLSVASTTSIQDSVFPIETASNTSGWS